MTDEEREACNAFINGYIGRKQAQDEWDPDPVGLMRVAYAAGRESMLVDSVAYAKEKGFWKGEADRQFKLRQVERERSSKLLAALERLRSRAAFVCAACEQSPASVIWNELTARIKFANSSIAEYEASRTQS